VLALSVISLLRSDSVAFGYEADMRTVDRGNQSDVNDHKRHARLKTFAPQKHCSFLR
jgi:hypothetical protein